MLGAARVALSAKLIESRARRGFFLFTNCEMKEKNIAKRNA